MTPKGTFAYTADREVFIPDIRVPPTDGDTYHPLRGCGYSLAVFRAGVIVGYSMSEDLGYPPVREWMDAVRTERKEER